MSTPLKIYIASSWRNETQPKMVETLRELGHLVYDFRNPQTPDELDSGSPSSRAGFNWASIDPDWETWSPRAYRDALDDYRAVEGFKLDMAALQWADVVLLLLPCGRSAHLEAGYAAGARKTVIVYLDGDVLPELMYRMAATMVLDEGELAELLRELQEERQTSLALKGSLMEED